MNRVTELTRDCFNALNQLRALDPRQVSPRGAATSVLGADRSPAGRRPGAVDAGAGRPRHRLRPGGAGRRDGAGPARPPAGLLAGSPAARQPVRREPRRARASSAGSRGLRNDAGGRRSCASTTCACCSAFRANTSGAPTRSCAASSIPSARRSSAGSSTSTSWRPTARAPTTPMLRRRERNPLLWISLAALAAAMAVYVGLRIVLDHQTEDLSEKTPTARAVPREGP